MIYYRHFGKALKQEAFNTLVVDLMKDAFAKGTDKVDYHDFYKYRISYITKTDLDLIFLFVSGLTNNFDNIKKELIKCKKEFLNLFEDIIKHKYDDKTFEVFDPTIDVIHKNLRPKISLVGFSGVGKTTITRLIKAEEIPMQHIPTITGDIATIKIGKLHFHLWDFAGQEQFSYLWNNFIKGSDAVLLITDSTLENVEKSKFFLELIKEQAPHAHTAIIGNKQDLENAMKPDQIEKILGLKTYSMIAKDPVNRDKMITIVADILEMSAEISPLLQPLLRRDTYIENATRALEDAKFEKAANLFEKISDLCIELGDDSLGREFFEKSQKIKNMLQQISPKKVPKPPISEAQQMKPSEETPVSKVEKIMEIKPLKELSPPIERTKLLEETPVSKVEKIMETKPLKEPLPPIERTKPSEEARVSEKIRIIETEAPKEPLPKIEHQEASEESVLLKESRIPKIASQPVETEVTETIEEESISPPLSEPKHITNMDTFQKPEVKPEIIGLDLNPEDFMVIQRPKTVTDVPKDAKKKLKTSPYAQVTNQEELKTSKDISPIKLTQLKPPKYLKPIKATTIAETKKPSEISEMKESIISSPKPEPESFIKPNDQELTSIESKAIPKIKQKSDLEKVLMDLKIKKANISKMSLEFDMKELTGEITAKELYDKKQKLKEIEENINNQIKDLEDLIKKFE